MLVNENGFLFTFLVWRNSTLSDALNDFKNRRVKAIVRHLINENNQIIWSRDIEYNVPKKVKTTYMTCPYCKKSHLITDYISPINGWDNLIKKYDDKLGYILYCCIAENNIFSIKEIIFNLLEDRSIPHKTSFVRSRDNENIYEDSIYQKIYAHPSIAKKKTELREFFIPISEFLNQDNELIYRCPNCASNIELGKTRRPGEFEDIKNYTYKRLERHKDWFQQNKYLYAYKIDFNEENSCLSVSLITNHVFPLPNAKNMVKQQCERITFNIKTGQSYRFRMIDLDTKTVSKEDEKCSRIMNMTYGEKGWVISVITKKIAIEIATMILEKKGVSLNLQMIFDDINENNKYQLYRTLFSINRYADSYSADFIKALVFEGSYIPLKDRKEFAHIQSNIVKLSKFLKKHKVNGKYQKNKCLKNPLKAKIVYFLKEIGFTNNDIINSFLENEDKLLMIVNNTSYIYDMHYSRLQIKNMREFITDYCEVKSETELVKKLSGNRHFFTDTVNMYYYLKEEIELFPHMKKELFKGDLKEIHDRISVLRDSLNKKNYYINYTTDDLKLNGSVDDYVFSLATTAKEMRDVGAIMHICVGSYAEEAWRKFCYIVFMKNKSGELQVCIELRKCGQTFELRQAKDYCNNVLSEEKKAPLVAWLKIHQIRFDNCYDSQRNSLFEINCESQNFVSDDCYDNYKIFDTDEECLKTRIDITEPCVYGKRKNSNNAVHYYDYLPF